EVIQNITLPTARPSVWIPKEAAIAQGEEKMIVCDIQGYYPKTLTVSWLLHNNSHTPPSRTSNLYRVCTEMEEPHADEFQVQWFKLSRDSEDCEAVALLSWDDVTEGVSLESDGSHHTSVLSLRLSTSEDKSRYRCVVRCKSQTFTRETTVHVKGEMDKNIVV
uniref:Ig-like domain-containing protein n=1 Tax=Periophthalmus magnuspinnatus TaxID=409849 RepID=A0A3B4A1A4_9GOBI